MVVPARPVSGEAIAVNWGQVAHDAAVAQDIQAGTGSLVWTASNLSGTATVTFPRAFASAPVVQLTAGISGAAAHYGAALVTVSATGFTAQGRRGDGTSQTATVPFQWLAYGPRA